MSGSCPCGIWALGVPLTVAMRDGDHLVCMVSTGQVQPMMDFSGGFLGNETY